MSPKRFRSAVLSAVIAFLCFSIGSCVRPKPPVIVVKAPEVTRPDEFTMIVLHTNDTHARVLQFNSFGNTCGEQEAVQGQCFGGVARRATAIRQVRQQQPNTILVDAGDQFQGTLFYTRFKGEPFQKFMNELGYDAMTLGNHEFDDGPPVLAEFARGLEFPIVSSNVDVSKDPLLRDLVKPWEILEVGGRKVGIVGCTTEDLPSLANVGPSVVVEDIDSSLAKAVDELEAQGVNIIVALSHAGLARDLEIATSVAGIDIIVGGHTHSYLSNTDPESEGPYPWMVPSPADEPVLVVTDYQWGKYLGYLQVTFGADGVALAWAGNPILLDDSIPEDEAVLSEAMEYDRQLEVFRSVKVGEAGVELGGANQVCRFYECNIGDLITDAMLWETRDQGTQIAFFNGGGIRASIPPGDITMENIMEVLPFLDTIATLELRGADIRQTLEHSVSRAESPQNEGTGRFLQVSGLQYSWDPSQPIGSRVFDVRVMNPDGTYSPLDDEAFYKVATSAFLRRGGDGHLMFKERAVNPYDHGRVLSDILADYIGQFSVVAPEIEGRINRMP